MIWSFVCLKPNMLTTDYTKMKILSFNHTYPFQTIQYDIFKCHFEITLKVHANKVVTL